MEFDREEQRNITERAAEGVRLKSCSSMSSAGRLCNDRGTFSTSLSSEVG